MRLIDADEIVTVMLYDDEHEEHYTESMTIADSLDFFTEEGCPKPIAGKWIIHKINGIPHTAECSHCHQHYDYEELRHLGRSKDCIDIPHCPNCGVHLKGEVNG